MRINSVCNQINFKRVIKVNSISNPEGMDTLRRVDDTSHEVENVLNSKKSYIYDVKEANNIRQYFRSFLGDYDGIKGIKLVRVGTSLFLLSGKDAKDYKKLEKSQKEYKSSIENSVKYSSNQKGKLIHDSYVRLGEMIKDRVENGKNFKPYSVIDFKSSSLPYSLLTDDQKSGMYPIHTKIDSYHYESTNKTFSELIDGHRNNNEDAVLSYKPEGQNILQNYSYETKSLSL